MAQSFFELDLLTRFPYQSGTVPTMVDVGAHIGFVSKPFAQKSWRIIAFEPEPSNHSALVENLSPYENVTIIHKAVSNQPGQSIEFYVSQEHWGIHSLVPFHETHRPIKVETVRLDETLADLSIEEIALLKIDTEGADFWVLQSCDFNRVKPELIMCEFGDGRSQEYFNYSHHDIVAYMKDFGYVPFVSEWQSSGKGYARKGEKSSPHTFVGCQPYPLDHEPAWGNLIFVRPDRLSDFHRILADYLDIVAPRHPGGKVEVPDSCNACGSPFMAYVKDIPTRRTNRLLPLYYCMECESFCNPSQYEQDDTQLAKARDWYASVEERDRKFSANLLKEILKLHPKIDSVLQVGCATGTLLSVAKEYCSQVTGYDTNSYSIDYGKDKFKLDLHHANWAADKTKPHDLILCIAFLEQSKNPDNAFKELATAAKRDKSLLYVSVPFFEREKWGYISTADPYEPGTPLFDNDVIVTHFSAKGLLALAKRHGATKTTQIKTSWQGYLFEF